MKLSIVIQTTSVISLSNLIAGDIFQVATGCTPYMLLDPFPENSQLYKLPVVSLANGHVYFFDKTRMVIALQGTLAVQPV